MWEIDSREARTKAGRPGRGQFQQPGGDHEWGYRGRGGNRASSDVMNILHMEKIRTVRRWEVAAGHVRDQGQIQIHMQMHLLVQGHMHKPAWVGSLFSELKG